MAVGEIAVVAAALLTDGKCDGWHSELLVNINVQVEHHVSKCQTGDSEHEISLSHTTKGKKDVSISLFTTQYKPNSTPRHVMLPNPPFTLVLVSLMFDTCRAFVTMLMSSWLSGYDSRTEAFVMATLEDYTLLHKSCIEIH